MNGLIHKASRLGFSVCALRRNVRASEYPSTYAPRVFSTLGDALIDPKKSSVCANADIVNYSLAGVYVVAYNERGFVLSNGAVIDGPMISFPQSALSWNITSAKDINEDSLSLFRVLCPELEVLIIGKGAASEEINQRKILDICWKSNLGVEIVPTSTAIGIFNFLNSEGRYVAAALIPPNRIDLFDGEKTHLKQLEADREVRMAIKEGQKIRKLPVDKTPALPKPLLKPPDKNTV